MNKSGVRVLHGAPNVSSNRALVLVLLMLIPLFYPIQQAEAEARIESQDFEILDRLSDVMGERQAVLDSNSVGQIAGPTVQGVRDGISLSGQSDPLSTIGESLEGTSFSETLSPGSRTPSPLQTDNRRGRLRECGQCLADIGKHNGLCDIDGIHRPRRKYRYRHQCCDFHDQLPLSDKSLKLTP